MKNITFFIILAVYYLFAAAMLDIVWGQGFLHGAIFIAFSLLLISLIILAARKIAKSERKFWELLKWFAPSVIGLELIFLFFFRMYILSLI